MGVKGLESFMEKNHIGKTVDVRNLIHQYKREYNCTPVIVIDGMSVMRDIYKKDKLSWILGGQMKEYEASLEEFIAIFQKEGAELVFFFDGPCVSSKQETWVKRRMQSLRNVYDLLDNIESGASINRFENERGLFILPSSLKATTVYIAKKCHCKVFTSIRECDLEIAEYASSNKCMAILAQDSDFVIFGGAKYYLSMKLFDFDRVTTFNYDRNKLASCLGIETGHLPLFSSLVGNDVISTEQLKNFHSRILRIPLSRNINFHQLFFKLAKFVKNWPSGFNINNGKLEAMAGKVFLDATKSSLIRESILSYNLSAQKNKNPEPPSSDNENWNNILKKIYKLNKTADIPSVIYSIMVLQEYRCSTCVEDYRKTDFLASQTLLKPVRERLYGILLHEKPRSSSSEVIKVEEMVVCSENSLKEPVFVAAVEPTVKHPGLLKLWSEEVVDDSWILIGYIFGIDYQEIKSLPPIFVVPALTIRYIHDHVLSIEEWELKALISSVVLVHMYSAKELSQINVSYRVSSTRPIRLFTLVTRCYSTTQFIIQSLGNPISIDKIQPSNYQDGKLFHHKYHEAQSIKEDFKLCDSKENAVQLFHQIIDFILHKGNK